MTVMDDLTKEQRHRAMSHIKATDTKIEVLLRKHLWKKGIRYRKNYALLPGKPDIVISKYRIAIFCDSEFFHGKDWGHLKEHLKSSINSVYWLKKIQRNIDRDTEITKQLHSLGWTVIRFWGKDIIQNPEECVQTIEDAILEQKIQQIELRQPSFPPPQNNVDITRLLEYGRLLYQCSVYIGDISNHITTAAK